MPHVGMNKQTRLHEGKHHTSSCWFQKKWQTKKKEQFWNSRQRRLTTRTKQYLHKISKDIVKHAAETKSILVLEDLTRMQKQCRKKNGKVTKSKRKMNNWPFYELQRQIEYKTAWVRIPAGFIDPKGTSKRCPKYGKNLQEDCNAIVKCCARIVDCS